MRGKLGATPAFGKAARALDCGRFRGVAAFTTATKSPGSAPGLFAKNKAGRSGRRLVILRRGDLDRLNRLARDFLTELGEFLRLCGECLELLAGVRGPQLQRL